MPLKKLKLSVETGPKPIEPQQIFQRLTLRGSIENIWEPQAEALRDWHRNRSDSDVAIEMNTGGGKTLVGLLIGRSLVNEMRKRVLYVCPNNQLVEQTYDRAREIGLSPARRYKSVWKDRREFDSGNEFCLTNYATVFNGKSIFRNEDIGGLIFDDAHVAENTIREQFTLRISSDHAAFAKILNLCRSHFTNSGRETHFHDVAEGRFASALFIPTFVVWKHASEFRRILLDEGVEEDDRNQFPWEHLKDHLNRCCFIADGKSLQITPAVPPLSELDYFQEKMRRVYLTATLPSQASFARTFGVSEPTTLRPSGKSGDAQRLLVFVQGPDGEVQREKAKEFVRERKSCVISPSAQKGENWRPPAIIYPANFGQGEIDRFARSEDAEMLGLVARYDGIDLPGDACRLLILDGLPTGESLIDRFIDESIQVETIRTSHKATRIVQAIGRIFRSNTDHGVVLLVGEQLQSWIRSPDNQAFLPRLLQKQLLLGVELERQVKSEQTTWEELIDGVLNGEENWDEMYDEYIDQFETEARPPAPDWHVQTVLNERKAVDQLWAGQFRRAAELYGNLDTETEPYDPRWAAWYRHWQGLALLCADEKQEAFLKFISAANMRSELGRPTEQRERIFKSPAVAEIGQQARTLAKTYRKRRTQLFGTQEAVRNRLIYGEEMNKAEEALSGLGRLLGLDAERPDNSKGTGPDVIWRSKGCPSVWGFELKTEKKEGGKYSKKEISQCHDHMQWLTVHHGDKCELTIVGRILPVSGQANPFAALRVTDLEAFQDLLDRTRKVLSAVESGDKTDLEQLFQGWLNYHGLNWPDCVESLGSRLAVDLAE